MVLSAGTFLGPYEVEAPLGAGGMGEVYRARDPRLGRTVAIKILNAEVAGEADARARFEREARAVAALSHPHICAIYDVSPDYLVMELVGEGPVAGHGRRPSRRTLAVASLIGFLAASVVSVTLWLTLSPAQAQRRPLSFHLAPPPGMEFQFSPSDGGSVISPDGRSVAFVAVTNGTPRLWIRGLDSLTAREIPGTDAAKLRFWKPDSSALGYFTSSDMRRIEASGGTPVSRARPTPEVVRGMPTGRSCSALIL
jgi:hypothetical protein